MPFEVRGGLAHIVADAAVVPVTQLVSDVFGALWPTLFQVRFKQPLCLKGFVAAQALQRALSVEPLSELVFILNFLCKLLIRGVLVDVDN